MTIHDLTQQYCALHVFNEYTRDTITRVARLFCERSGAVYVSDIDTEALTLYRRNMDERNVAAATYNGYLRYLRLLGRYATDEGLTSSNPFSKLGLMPEPQCNLSNKAVTIDEINRALAYLKSGQGVNPGWFWSIVIRFLFHHGVRRRQLCEIAIGDVDMDDATVLLRHSGSKTRREWLIPLHNDSAADIVELLDRHGAGKRPGEQLFNVTCFDQRYVGTRMTPEQVTGAMKRLYRRTGIQIGAQRLRHTTATEICNAHPDDGTPDLFAAQYLLGHTMLSTTRRYVKPRLSRIRASTERALKLRK